MTIVLIVVAGISGYIALPRLEDPETGVRWAYIYTRLPGASAERVENLVTEKIENRIREVEGITAIESNSHIGISVILIGLTDEVRDVEAVWTEMRDKVADAETDLPPEASTPEFIDWAWFSNALVLALTWESEAPVDKAILTRMAKTLENRLRYVSGTKFTLLYGEAREEVLVEVDTHQLSTLELTPADVTQSHRVNPTPRRTAPR